MTIDKLGTSGLFITAIFSPCCFPLFAFGASALGLGSFELFGGWTMYVFIAMVIISNIGFYIAYKKHECLYPLMISTPSALLIFYGHYDSNVTLLYIGMFGILAATIVNYYRFYLDKKYCCCKSDTMGNPNLISTLTCPECGHTSTETMPTNACQFFYECEKCKKVLRPLPGDCCVYCSYGSVKCPPIQADEKCC